MGGNAVHWGGSTLLQRSRRIILLLVGCEREPAPQHSLVSSTVDSLKFLTAHQPILKTTGLWLYHACNRSRDTRRPTRSFMLLRLDIRMQRPPGGAR